MSGEVAFAAEISEDRKYCAIVAAGRAEDGRILVDLAPEFYCHPRDAVGKLADLYAKHDPVAVVVDPRSQAGTLLRPLAEAGVLVTEPSTAEVVAAHGTFLDLVNDGRLAHLDQPPLTSAVRAAQQRPLAGAAAWERRLAVDQSPLVAATLAVWAFTNWEQLSSPSAWIVLGKVRTGTARSEVARRGGAGIGRGGCGRLGFGGQDERQVRCGGSWTVLGWRGEGGAGMAWLGRARAGTDGAAEGRPGQ